MKITYRQHERSKKWIFTVDGTEYYTRQLATMFGICRTTLNDHARLRPVEITTRFIQEHWEKVTLGLREPDVVTRDGVVFWRRLDREYSLADVLEKVKLREESAVRRLNRWSSRELTSIDLFANNHNSEAGSAKGGTNSDWGDLGLGPRRDLSSVKGPTQYELRNIRVGEAFNECTKI